LSHFRETARLVAAYTACAVRVGRFLFVVLVFLIVSETHRARDGS